jgi:hypothetical protein
MPKENRNQGESQIKFGDLVDVRRQADVGMPHELLGSPHRNTSLCKHGPTRRRKRMENDLAIPSVPSIDPRPLAVGMKPADRGSARIKMTSSPDGRPATRQRSMNSRSERRGTIPSRTFFVVVARRQSTESARPGRGRQPGVAGLPRFSGTFSPDTRTGAIHRLC